MARGRSGQSGAVHARGRRHIFPMLAVAAVLASFAAAALGFMPVFAQEEGAVSGLTLTSDSPGTLAMSWDVPDQTPTDYRVNWGKSAEDFPSYAENDGNAYPTTNSHTVTGLEEGIEYKVRVRARYRGDQLTEGQNPWATPWSEEATVTIASQTTDPTPSPPGAPTGLVATAAHDKVELTWTAPAGSTVTGYQILRRQTGVDEPGDFQVHVDDTGNTDTTYTDTDVEAEARYVYRVKARNGDLLSPRSSFANAELPASPDPDSTRDGAVDLGDITGLSSARFSRHTIKGGNDRVDYFKFSITEPKLVNLGLRQLDFNADLILEDSEGTALAESRNDGAANEVTVATLLEGTYYIRVEAREKGVNEYVLRYGVGEPDPEKVDEARKSALKQDVTVSFDNAEHTVDEGENVTVTVTLGSAQTDKVTIGITSSSQSGAGTQDYSGVPPTLEFVAGDTEESFTVTIEDDDEDDDDESVTIGFDSLPTGISAGGTAEVVINITDNDLPQVTLNFKERTYTVEEGDSVDLKITLSADPESAVGVNLTYDSLGAVSGTDYSSPSTSIAFSAGVTEKTVTITALTDSEVDHAESFEVTLSSSYPQVSEGETIFTTVTITESGAAATAPRPPVNVDALPHDQNHINLVWEPPTFDGGSPVTGYKIEVSADKGAKWNDLVANTSTTDTAYLHGSLAAGVTRQYRVSAINSVGTSQPTRRVIGGTKAVYMGIMTRPNHADTQVMENGTSVGQVFTTRRYVPLVTGLILDVARWDEGVEITIHIHGGLGATEFHHFRPGPRLATLHGPDTPGTGLKKFVPEEPFPLPFFSVADSYYWNGQLVETGHYVMVFESTATGEAKAILRTTLADLTADTPSNGAVYGLVTSYDTDPPTVEDTRIKMQILAARSASAPGFVDDLAAMVLGRTRIDLSWNPPDNDGEDLVTGYLVQFQERLSDTWVTLADGQTGTEYSHTGLTPNRRYTYRVAAINGQGVGRYSFAEETTPLLTKPSAPANLTATKSGTNTIDLSWETPADNGGAEINGYNIRWSADGSQWRHLVVNTGNLDTTHSDTGLSPGTTRYYQVLARSSEGLGELSNVASATTDSIAVNFDRSSYMVAESDDADSTEVNEKETEIKVTLTDAPGKGDGDSCEGHRARWG